MKESRVPLELVSSPLVSAGVEGGIGCIRSTELGTEISDMPDVVAGGVGGPETEVGGVGGKSDTSELRDLLCIKYKKRFQVMFASRTYKRRFQSLGSMSEHLHNTNSVYFGNCK